MKLTSVDDTWTQLGPGKVDHRRDIARVFLIKKTDVPQHRYGVFILRLWELHPILEHHEILPRLGVQSAFFALIQECHPTGEG